VNEAPHLALTRGTLASAVDLEIPSQREDPTQLEKPERKDSRVLDDGPQRPERERANFRSWIRTRPEQHLILNDVADAGENLLVEKHIRNLRVRELPDSFERRLWIPRV
jgi:hypothetical protein